MRFWYVKHLELQTILVYSNGIVSLNKSFFVSVGTLPPIIMEVENDPIVEEPIVL